MKIRAMVFDLDGTLLDSLGMWSELVSRFLREFGIDPPEGIDEEVKPMTVEEACAYIVARFSLPITAEEAVRTVSERAAKAYLEELPLKPDAKRFLQTASEKGIPCALATVTYPALLPAALKRLGIADCFQAVLTADDFPEGKTEPEMYLEAARRLGAAPAETLVFEDALYAAKTAKAAGFPVVGIRDVTAEPEWAELEQICDRTADSWAELLKIWTE